MINRALRFLIRVYQIVLSPGTAEQVRRAAAGTDGEMTGRPAAAWQAGLFKLRVNGFTVCQLPFCFHG